MTITSPGCNLKDHFTFFPDKSSIIPEAEIPAFVSEHFFRTSDGESVQSFHFNHQQQGLPLVVYFHGNAGNLYHRFDAANRLFGFDQNVLLVSYRGYAKSTGKPNEQGIYLDGEAAINYAIQNLGYAENEISILGRSLGSAVAVHIAQNRKFRNIILITPLTSGSDMAVAMGLGLFKFMAGNSYNSLEKINQLQSRLLIIHGDRDEVVPYFMGTRLYEEFKGEKFLVTIENGRHNDLQDVNPELFWGEIARFLSDSAF
jgi:fermentation-respiration switch protein FrsA (DUF1100 family)